MKAMGFKFRVLARDKKTSARTGIISTAHGKIFTPAFVAVGTQATVKSLTNEDLVLLGTQVFFVNTYHLYLRPGEKIIKEFGGLHEFIGWSKPLMTDSGGFQIFSFGRTETPLVKINNNGVVFRSHLDGSEHIFTPEKSLEVQCQLGADILIAFDECAFYPAPYSYTKAATERTHSWAERSLKTFRKMGRKYQVLYGVIQGGVFRDLRESSAKFISGLDFTGIAIGGVSVGESKKEMVDVLDWVMPNLPEQKPKHLLGVGEIDDIFNLVERGMDTFDCVMPTRLGRMGWVLIKPKIENRGWKLDITKSEYETDTRPIAKDCKCFVCRSYSRAYLNHLFRAKELLAYRLATYHNLYFMERLMECIRLAIAEGSFLKLKEEWR